MAAPPLPFEPTPAVQEALSLDGSALVAPAPSEALRQVLAALPAHERPASRDIFSIGGAVLPCWRDEDDDPRDPWLISPDYYPAYHALFELLACGSAPRVLEIGVRTGYISAVLAHATRGGAFYLGVDPNFYLANGMELANRTCRLLAAQHPGFEYALVEGCSWDPGVRRTLAWTAPFDIIHIDGDHTLPGKLHDLDLARHLGHPNTVVLVDDYDYHAIVADAITRVLALGWFSEFGHVATMRGLAVLRGARQP